MQGEVHRTLYSPNDKIDVIYNGILPHKKPKLSAEEVGQIRRQYAKDEEKIVYYVGRMTPEKGLYVLIDAIPKVCAQLSHQVKFVFIGGGYTDRWEIYARDRGVSDKCIFTGFMSDWDLDRFQTVADCAVFPSLYEPFGIVALESFAARVPVVVSDAGGLAEIIKNKRTGIVTLRNNSESLAWGIIEVLTNRKMAQQMVENAYNELPQRFNWTKIAHSTLKVYEKVVKERKLSSW
jgi:glycosyltransferase involved in cell wall biosynthesis